MTREFEGKTVLITGGSGDIGRAMCDAYASRGANVAFTFFSNHDNAARTAEMIESHGVKAHMIRANLRDDKSAKEVSTAFREVFTCLDILISNAASGVLKPALSLSRKHWDWTMNINARAFHQLCVELHDLIPAGGRVLALSSAGATRAIDNYCAIGASKAALEATARHLSTEFGPKGVTVNVISPGVVDTNALKHFPNREQLLEVANYRTPNGRIATPADVADVAVLLCSPLAKMIQGQTIVVDGGYSILA